jgi:tRNA modification GTPase
MSLRQHQDTIVAAATPSGKSALALVRVTGCDAIKVVGSLCREPLRLYAALGGSTVYVDLVDSGSSVIDDVVLSVFRAPRSFTGEDLVEISCHGSPVIVQQIVNALLATGCRQALPGEFSQRAFFNGKISIEQAELIDSRIAAESVGELRGSERAIQEKYERLRALYDNLIALLAKINAQIDFGESDDIAFDDLTEDRNDLVRVVEELIHQASVRSANAGHISIALVGPPNVGKSSLFNAMLKFERSIVSDTPGTTRDYLESFLPIEGFRIKLIDTAGIREASESIEARGIGFTHEVRKRADVVMYLTDPDSRSSQPEGTDLVIHNKSDIDGWQEGIAVSAKSGAGLEKLHTHLVELVRRANSEASGILLTTGEMSLLEKMRSGLKAMDLTGDLTLAAEDLRLVIDNAAQLLGTNINEDTLNHIFQRMCIGK